MGVNSLPKTVTRQRRDCDLNPALLRLSPARYPLGYRATHEVHRCGLFPQTYSVVGASVHLCVCWSQSSVVQKRNDRSRCCLEYGLACPHPPAEEPRIAGGGVDPGGKRAFWVISRRTVKAGNIRRKPKLFARWQQRCGLSLSCGHSSLLLLLTASY